MARKKPVMISYFERPLPQDSGASALATACREIVPSAENDLTTAPVVAPTAHRPDPSGLDATPTSPTGNWTLVERPSRRTPAASTDLLGLEHQYEANRDHETQDSQELNQWLPEKLIPQEIETMVEESPAKLPAPYAIREYIAQANLPVSTDSWLSRPEIPTTAEILDLEEPAEGTVCIPPNKIDGAWDSKEAYLESHYELLREDTIRPLREVVGRIKNKPWASEQEYGSTVGVYSNVRIVGFTFSARGLATRVQFSLSRSGKRIHWEQSKRLITGTLLALTPEADCFQTQCVMAVVAARPLASLVQDPPEIDIFFARAEEAQLDPNQSWLMVEERSSYFEGTRHTLRALQKLMREPFPLSEHIINAQQTVEPPKYLLKDSQFDLSSIFEGAGLNVDIIKDWPEAPDTELDKTQLHALQCILTKRCAIVQGPPGTGKTHVSVVALKALLSNMNRGLDAPIIVACQTNHALDQLLRHVAEFEPDFARLGGRTRDRDVIKKRTLYELKQAETLPYIAGGQMKPANIRLRQVEARTLRTLSPVQLGASFFSHDFLYKLGLLTRAQFESLERGDTLWVDHRMQQNNYSVLTESRIEEWIGKHYERVEQGIPPDEFAFDYEEVDLEFEQLKEMEAENMVKDDEDFETLRGATINVSANIVGKPSANITDDDIRVLLSTTKDMYRIKDRQRGSVYNYLRQQAMQLLLHTFRVDVKEYEKAILQRTIGRWEIDHMVLRKQKIIGMTTTGLSKYRALISSLRPKVVLIEEAAETLEAPVTASCVPSLEHLILVGDHQQLRPHCHVQDHENEPFNLNMSLFERLVRNEVEYSTLRRQRRMIPEIRRLLKPIYGDLIKDHPSTKDPEVRAPISGMGDVSSFFFTHEWPESVDAQMSSCNVREADMIVKFYVYLFMNNIGFSDITVLTFYNGQRKLILSKLRSHPDLQGTGRDFRVVTVDSYQGEENEIILLSLVRNNQEDRIGFLNNDNRICVALSRAKRGLYMFGNGQLLASESKTWSRVITTLAGKLTSKKSGEKMSIGYHLPLTCINHGLRTYVGDLDDWETISGGCEMSCNGRLPCGHACPYRCHPYGHEFVNCLQKCRKVLVCGHTCAGVCADECRCTICIRKSDAILRPGARPTVNVQNAPTTSAASLFPGLPSPRSGPTRQSRSVNKPSLGRQHQPGLGHQPGAVSSPAPPTTNGRSDSTGSDPVAWKAYSKNVRSHDAQLVRMANEDYRRKERELEQRNIAALEEETERSVFDDSYRSAPSPEVVKGASISSSTTAVGTVVDGQAPTPRKKWVESYSPYCRIRRDLTEPSLIDGD